MNLRKSPGQLAYERDLAARPNYQDGARRPSWNRLGDVAKSSWERDPSDRNREEAFAQLRTAGIESYCQQICGGGYCGTGSVCQYGIDAETEMPIGFYPPSEGQDVRPD